MTMSVDRIVLEASERWRVCEGLPETDLLRLAVLRDLVHRLHAEKSRLLSTGKRSEATSIRSLENLAEDMRNCKPLTGSLEDQLSGRGTPLKKRARLLPEAVFTHLRREKLERYDRQWEAALVSEALSQNWGLWALESAVEVPKIEQWNRRFGEQLWPDGIILFVESAREEQNPASDVWLGRWICLLHPKIADPGTLSSVQLGSQASSWKLLFSQKTG